MIWFWFRVWVWVGSGEDLDLDRWDQSEESEELHRRSTGDRDWDRLSIIEKVGRFDQVWLMVDGREVRDSMRKSVEGMNGMSINDERLTD